MSNSFDPVQAQPDLGPNYLQRLSVDDTSKQRVKVGMVFGKVNLTSNMTLSHILPIFLCPENVASFLRLLNIFKCTSD